jgi:putative membrane protein
MTLIRTLFLAWILNFFALLIAFKVVGSANTTGIGALVLAAAVFSLLNTFVKPVLMLIGLPFRIITFGLVTFLINMAMVAITAGLVDGITVGGFWSVAEITVVVWIANMLLQMALGVGRAAKRS